MTVNTNRKTHLDILKAVACILVVAGHALSLYGERVRALTPFESTLSMLIYAVHVPLFFTVAGYLCHPQPIGPYAKKKVFRILIPFVFFTVLKILFSSFVSPDYSHHGSFAADLLYGLLYGELYWFMYAILLMYVIAPLFWEKGKASPGLLWTEGILLAGLLVFNSWTTLSGRQLTDLLQIRNMLLNLPFFLAGMMIRQREAVFLRFAEKAKWLLTVLSLAMIVLAIYVFLPEADPLIYPVSAPLSFALIWLFYCGAKKLPRTLPGLRTVSRYSLQIMLFDSFIKILLLGLWSRFFPVPVVMVIVFTAADVLLGCLASRICERIPLINTLVGL